VVDQETLRRVLQKVDRLNPENLVRFEALLDALLGPDPQNARARILSAMAGQSLDTVKTDPPSEELAG